MRAEVKTTAPCRANTAISLVALPRSGRDNRTAPILPGALPRKTLHRHGTINRDSIINRDSRINRDSSTAQRRVAQHSAAPRTAVFQFPMSYYIQVIHHKYIR